MYHRALGRPAAVAFTDGRYVGATLDRNGLRPARYYLTSDDMIILSSEVGVTDVDESTIIKKERLHPGKNAPYRYRKGQGLFQTKKSKRKRHFTSRMQSG